MVAQQEVPHGKWLPPPPPPHHHHHHQAPPPSPRTAVAQPRSVVERPLVAGHAGPAAQALRHRAEEEPHVGLAGGGAAAAAAAAPCTCRTAKARHHSFS
jgi:hypothetical protein